MTGCLFPFLSRTGPRLPAALFIGNRLHSILTLHRNADGYAASFSPELQAYLDSAAVQAQGIGVKDLDAPRASPMLYSRESGWSTSAHNQSAPESVAHDLAIAGLRRVDFWPTDSLSTTLATLVALGYHPDSLTHAIFLDLMGRPADAGALVSITPQLVRGAAQVSDLLVAIMGSVEFQGLRHSINERRGEVIRMMISVARHCRTPNYQMGSGSSVQLGAIADYSAEVALTGGWWKPVGRRGEIDYWSSYSFAIVLRPPTAGRWTFRGTRSERDAGIAIKRWRLTGEPGVEGRLIETGEVVELEFDSPAGAAVLVELEADRFFVPSDTGSDLQDHRSLSLCFKSFDLVGANASCASS